MKRTTCARFAALFGLLLAAPPVWLGAQTKVVVIDFQRALLETAEMKQEAAKLEQKFQPRQEEIQQISQQLQEIQQKLQTATGSEALSLQQEGQRKQREAQRLTEDLQADVDFERNVILENGARKLREAVSKLAEESGYDLVVDSTNTIFHKPVLDITQQATAAYDAAYPVSQSP